MSPKADGKCLAFGGVVPLTLAAWRYAPDLSGTRNPTESFSEGGGGSFFPSCFQMWQKEDRVWNTVFHPCFSRAGVKHFIMFLSQMRLDCGSPEQHGKFASERLSSDQQVLASCSGHLSQTPRKTVERLACRELQRGRTAGLMTNWAFVPESRMICALTGRKQCAHSVVGEIRRQRRRAQCPLVHLEVSFSLLRFWFVFFILKQGHY